MLKSLDKLCSNKFAYQIQDVSSAVGNIEEELREIAGEIQAEIDDDFYIPSTPLGELCELVASAAKQGVSPDELKKVLDIACKHGSLDAWIDRYYLPRPLFEDGEPVQFDDEIMDGMNRVNTVISIEYFRSGKSLVRGISSVRAQDNLFPYEGVKRFRRPPACDTQEKIDETVYEIAHCFSISGTAGRELYDAINGLLERQRKICEAQS